jgi:hypothetical protein
MEGSEDTHRALLNHSPTAPARVSGDTPTNNNHLSRSPEKRYDGPPVADMGEGSSSAWMEFKPVINQMDRILENKYRVRNKIQISLTVQGKVYNFLERPTGWKCFIYHFTV